MVVKIKFNDDAFRKVRTSPKARAEIERRAKAIAEGCGDGFVVESGVTGGRGRARSAVIAASVRANRRNARDNTLLRNLDRGRG